LRGILNRPVLSDAGVCQESTEQCHDETAINVSISETLKTFFTKMALKLHRIKVKKCN
jgi:hypothetical protein